MNIDVGSDLLVGESLVMRRLRAHIARIARTSVPVFIQGESGSGKELVAQALHAASGRTGAFVAFNICAIPEALFESALFGHVRGSFTGATTDALGYLAEAHNGTVFLDELGELALALQAKLLRAIETRTFRPVGGRQDRLSHFRVVASTNVDLQRLVTEGRFRRDLAYRLCGDVITVPPLRDRLDDLAGLVRHFAQASELRGVAHPVVSSDAIELLKDHEWVGNVRELRNVVERAMAQGDGLTIDAKAIAIALGGSSGRQNGANEKSGFARRRLRQVLTEHGWRDERAAAALGVHPTTVYRWRKALGIERPKSDTPRALRDQSAPQSP